MGSTHPHGLGFGKNSMFAFGKNAMKCTSRGMDRVAGRVLGLAPLVLVLGLGIGGCAMPVSDRLPTAQVLEEAGYVRVSEEQMRLRNGRAAVQTDCTNCHRLYEPSEFSPEDWIDLLPDMVARTSLSRSQANDLEAYLVDAARFAEEKRRGARASGLEPSGVARASNSSPTGPRPVGRGN